MQPSGGRALRHGWMAMLLVFGLASVATAQEAKSAPPKLDGSKLQPTTVTYTFTVNGEAGGTTTMTLARDGDEWVAKEDMKTDMFSSQSEARFQASDLAAVSVKRTMSGNGMSMNTDLKLDSGKIVGTSAGMNGEQTVNLAVPAGTLLPQTDVYALMVLPLAAGQTVTLPVYSTRSGAVEDVSYKVDGEESLTVPAGTFDAYKVEVSSGDQPATLWVRKAMPHVLLKREISQFPVVIEAKSVE